MILPAVRERLETVLRHPSMDGAIAALRAGGQHVSLGGLHEVAKALIAAYIAHELRRPAFFVADSNRRAESLAETLRFFSTIFPSSLGGVATLPAFDTLPWQSQSPHADILERRAATLFRLTDGQISLLVAPVSAALWRYQDPYVYLSLARTLATDAEIPLEELITHVGSVGYTRTEMVEMPGQFDHFGARVADRADVRDQFFQRDLRVSRQGTRQRKIDVGVLVSPQCRAYRRDQERYLSVGDAEQRGRAALENVRVRALRLPRERVERRQRGDAAERAGENGGEEAQRVGQGLRAAIGIGDKEGRAAQLVRDVRGDHRFCDVVQTGQRNMLAARAQCGDCAVHRRMAQHSFKPLADCRKDHSRKVRILGGSPTRRRGFSSEFRWWSSPARQARTRRGRPRPPPLRGQQSGLPANRRP